MITLLIINPIRILINLIKELLIDPNTIVSKEWIRENKYVRGKH